MKIEIEIPGEHRPADLREIALEALEDVAEAISRRRSAPVLRGPVLDEDGSAVGKWSATFPPKDKEPKK